MKPFALLWLALTAAAFCTACSTAIIPLPTATAQLDQAGAALVETRDGVAITARVDQLSVQPYQLAENLASFHVTIDNRTNGQVVIDHEAFVLRDAEGRQFLPISPERVREIVSKDTVYLIPYPFVGYYYLEDQERWAFSQTMASSLPYYAEYHPQDLFTRALPAGPILPHSKVAGVIYFLVDPTLTSRIELLLFADSRLQGEPRYRFPFGKE